MTNNIEVVGIDHGWSQIKTLTTVFPSAIEENPSPTFFKDVLEYEGKCYSISTRRSKVKDSKVEDNEFYLLTLVGIAKELQNRGGMTEANVYLAGSC